jgi:hypothetical protein
VKRDQEGAIIKDERGNWQWDEWYECQLMIGYRGFITLFSRSRLVRSITAEAVYEGDFFDHEKGTNTFLKYKKNLVAQRGELAAAFCYVELADRGQSFSVLTLADIYRSRAKSQAWNTAFDAVQRAKRAIEEDPKATGWKAQKLQRDLATAEKNFAETPWNQHEGPMASKTAIRLHSKAMSLEDDSAADQQINLAADLDSFGDNFGGPIVDMAAMANPERASEVFRGDGHVPLEEEERQPDTGAEDGRDTSAPSEDAAGKPAPTNAEAGGRPSTSKKAPEPAPVTTSSVIEPKELFS